MTALSPQEIMLAAALVFGIATLCQVVAPLLRIPALILLLPAGFLLGLAAPQLRFDLILGRAFPVAVDLMVALILFQGGLELGTTPLGHSHKGVVKRLVWIGAPVTWLLGATAAHYLLDLTWSLALLIGAILVVSGPTVVTPILNFARPNNEVRGILLWEGTTLDPLGGIFAVVVFQAVRVSEMDGPVKAALALVGSIAVAVVVAAIAVVVAVLGSKAVKGNKLLGVQLLVGTVLAAAGIANYISEDSGLLTALLMGVAAHPVSRRLNASLDATVPFFNVVSSIGVGILFVSIAALVPSPLIAALALPAMGVALLLIVFVRPLVAAVCTRNTDLSAGERAFIGWMDPRGIVAAATASSVGASLVAANVAGAEKLLPAVFVIITVTVFVYGLTAVPVATMLGVRQETSELPSKSPTA